MELTNRTCAVTICHLKTETLSFRYNEDLGLAKHSYAFTYLNVHCTSLNPLWRRFKLNNHSLDPTKKRSRRYWSNKCCILWDVGEEDKGAAVVHQPCQRLGLRRILSPAFWKRVQTNTSHFIFYPLFCLKYKGKLELHKIIPLICKILFSVSST